MTSIVPQHAKFIQVPLTTGDHELSPAMAVTCALAYDKADGPMGQPRFLSETKWLRLMGPLECQCAGLKKWTKFCRSKTKSKLVAHGLMSPCDGGYWMMPPKPFLKLPKMILAHPELTVGLKVHWAKYQWSTNGKVGCVPAWCGYNHCGPVSKSHAQHAADFVRRGLATVSNGCCRLIPLELVAGNQPELLTSTLSDAIQYWSLRQDENRRAKMIRDRDVVARAWASRLSHGDERRDTEGWMQFNAELSQIAMQAKTLRDLLDLGYRSGYQIGRNPHLCLEQGQWIEDLPDPDGFRMNGARRHDRSDAGKRHLDDVLGFMIF